MVCLVVARNGEGEPWLFGSLPEARLHPIPQMDDVYATTPEELVAQYGRSQADSLLRFAEGRDRAALVAAVESWRSDRSSELLSVEARRLVWDKVKKVARKPPTDPAEIVRIVTADRAAREGRTLRSLPDPHRQSAPTEVKGTEMADTARRTRISDDATITIKTEDGKNPKRAGSASYERFALYKDGMTVKAAKAAGVSASDIAYDSEKGYIEVAAPAAA